MFMITVEGTFDAAHRLDGYPGKCSNLHGHTWKVEATWYFTELNGTGMTVDFKELDKILQEVLEVYDHQYLNDHMVIPPTAENLARLLFLQLDAATEILLQELPSSGLSDVTVWETEKHCATYMEDAAIGIGEER